MSQDWIWVAAIFAIPVLIFGAAELVGMIRRRRLNAVARRPKAVDGRRSSSGGSRPEKAR